MYHRDPRCVLSILAHVSALSDDPITSQMWMLVFFTLHACDVSFTIANYNVMGTSSSSATDKCTKMLNSRWGSRRYMGL